MSSIFQTSELVIVRSQPRAGALPLPADAQVFALREPRGEGLRRKLDVLFMLPYYLYVMAKHVRRADVIHVPLPGDLPLLGMLVAVVFRKPVIARYGGSWKSTSVTTTMNNVTRNLMRWLAGGKNVMLATGEDVGKPAVNMEWMFTTALSTSEMRGIQPQFDRGLNTPARIVFAGRLSSEKGADVLIRALAILNKDNVTQLHVTFLGDGPQRSELERLVDALDCRGQVSFEGQVNRKQLNQYLSASDFAVQPSFTEGLSKAWLDEMSHGLPLVATRVGAAEAVVGGDNVRGWIVPPGDPEALAATIRDVLLTPRDWPALRRRCREYAETRTTEKWADAIAMLCAKQWRCSFSQGKLTY
ncbi:MAG: glycosyltransferase [Acidobacteriota bacterium]